MNWCCLALIITYNLSFYLPVFVGKVEKHLFSIEKKKKSQSEHVLSQLSEPDALAHSSIAGGTLVLG